MSIKTFKLPVSPSEFAKTLKKHIGAISDKPDLFPLSNNVLIEVEESRMLLTTTNGINFVRSRIEADSSETFSMCLPYKKMVALMGQLSDQKVKLKYDENDFLLEIKAKEGTYEIKGHDPVGFAKFPDSEAKSEWFQCSHAKFKEAVSSVVFACGNDDARPAMKGVYVEAGKQLEMTASDGSILSNYELKDSFEVYEPKSEIVNAESMKIVSGLNADEDVEAYSDDKNQWFEVGEIEICARKIDANYPNWRNAVPGGLKSVKVDSDLLKHSVDRALLFVNEVTKLVTVDVNHSFIEITAEDIGFECKAGEVVDLESEAQEKISLALHAAVLSSILSHTNKEVVNLKYVQPNRAVLWEHSAGFILQIPIMSNTY
ncbi:DNA polymerase III subunit beta [Runella limosa]|uniref:DNA polymerase III subunit beta n=1 Tax=Runella limosa TaxID=370978 RepID=UPI000417B1F0|nr:hypothetical protein [Runella limosa]